MFNMNTWHELQNTAAVILRREPFQNERSERTGGGL